MTEQPDLFSTPPAQRHSSTSLKAAHEAKPLASTLRRKVLAVILAEGGLTDEQIQDRLHLNPSTQRPRRIELMHAGLVRDSDLRRRTRSGRLAVVWEAVQTPRVETVRITSGAL